MRCVHVRLLQSSIAVAPQQSLELYARLHFIQLGAWHSSGKLQILPISRPGSFFFKEKENDLRQLLHCDPLNSVKLIPSFCYWSWPISLLKLWEWWDCDRLDGVLLRVFLKGKIQTAHNICARSQTRMQKCGGLALFYQLYLLQDYK